MANEQVQLFGGHRCPTELALFHSVPACHLEQETSCFAAGGSGLFVNK
jgi:hypothetical protein